MGLGRERGGMELEQLLPMWAVICPLVFLGAVMDAVAGGGGLLSLPAYLLAGLDPHMAIGTNKLGNLPGMATSAIRFLRRGNVHLPSAVWCALGSLVGAWLGSQLNMRLPSDLLYYLMLILVPILAVFLIKKRDFGMEDHSGELSPRRLNAISLVSSLVIGVYDGFFGPGAGTFLILANTGLCRFGLLTASGNMKVASVASCGAAMVSYAVAGHVMWLVALPAALCSIAGAYVGAGLALKNGAKLIRPMFVVVLALLLIRLIYDLMAGG